MGTELGSWEDTLKLMGVFKEELDSYDDLKKSSKVENSSRNDALKSGFKEESVEELLSNILVVLKDIYKKL